MPRLTPTVRTSCRKRLTNSMRRFRLSCRPPKKSVKQQSARRRPRSKFSNRKPRPLQPERPNDATLAGVTATTIARPHSGWLEGLPNKKQLDQQEVTSDQLTTTPEENDRGAIDSGGLQEGHVPCIRGT